MVAATSVLSSLNRRATHILAVGVFLGILLPDLAAALRPFLAPAVWGLLLLAALRLDRARLATLKREPGTTAAVVAWLLILSPIAMAVVMAVVPVPADLKPALLLMAAVPPIMSSPALALMLGLDASLTLVVMVAGTLIVSITLPLIAPGFLAVTLDIDPVTLGLRLAVFIGSALLVAAVLRVVATDRRIVNAGGVIDGLALLLLVIFALAIMDGIAAELAIRPVKIAMIVGAAFVGYTALHVVGALLFAWLPRRSALTIGFASANRNMGLLLAVLPAGTSETVFLYFILAQIPIYVMPSLLAPIYKRLLTR